jgi:hypothetical protein
MTQNVSVRRVAGVAEGAAAFGVVAAAFGVVAAAFGVAELIVPLL